MIDVEEDSLLLSISLAAWSDTLGIEAGKFDPKVQYDPKADRFVLLCLAGFSSDDTHIIVGFSQTNNPIEGWNLYSFPGNPKDNETWTDYPMMALTETELIITINLLVEDESWQTGFTETLIWQTKLDQGYNGEELDVVFHDDVQLDGKPVRNLRPIQGGSDTYGPDIYFVSNRNFDIENDTVFFLHLTGTMDDPSTELEIGYLIADQPYGVPPEALQPSNHTFDTNDGRILGAFIEDNTIHLVVNFFVFETGLA